ncbi:MAG: DUF3566 domain-containing protein [Cellulomonadaceae bacterium]|nr:DUF3566 domain-containing protein [Cellulomonadaceae bacterium]
MSNEDNMATDIKAPDVTAPVVEPQWASTGTEASEGTAPAMLDGFQNAVADTVDPSDSATAEGEEVAAGAFTDKLRSFGPRFSDWKASAGEKISQVKAEHEEKLAKAKAERDAHVAAAAGAAGTAAAQASASASASAVSHAPRTGATPVLGPPRKVRLTLSRIDPWSVMKMAFLLAVAVGVISVVAVTVFWTVIDSLHLFTTVQDFINDAIGSAGDVNVTQYLALGRIVSLATLVSVANIVIMTALATIMTILYNITAALVGGIHVTLTDD